MLWTLLAKLAYLTSRSPQLKNFLKMAARTRVMGLESKSDTISSALRSAKDAGIESAWVVDHPPIPADDAENWGGRYLEPLLVLSWTAG